MSGQLTLFNSLFKSEATSNLIINPNSTALVAGTEGSERANSIRAAWRFIAQNPELVRQLILSALNTRPLADSHAAATDAILIGKSPMIATTVDLVNSIVIK